MSDEPVFKKRRRGPAAGASSSEDTLKQLLSSSQGDDNSGGGGRPSSGDGDGADGDGEEQSVQDLLLLRQLSKRPTGIELNKLNAGERKVKKKVKKDASDGKDKTAEERWADQMSRGGLMNGSGGAAAGAGGDEDDDDEQEKASSKRIVRNNFQGETNIVDVDKHMLAYIEEEMRKRSGRSGEAGPSADQVRAALQNPEDELYRVAEKYRDLQTKTTVEDEEGNVTLSTTMLTSIPEVDLGMDVRLKNIEETEKAKRLLAEQRKAEGRTQKDKADDQFAAARFYRPKFSTQSDVDALKMAREGLDPTAEITHRDQPHGSGSSSTRPQGSNQSHNQDRRAMATDEIVMERFKKRQRQHLK
ncbi:hypothetical protein CF327_g5195 [Tilletia walkeri]|nr:hypothetical protein CF327_g5195 [Tilletia walkeri]